MADRGVQSAHERYLSCSPGLNDIKAEDRERENYKHDLECAPALGARAQDAGTLSIEVSLLLLQILTKLPCTLFTLLVSSVSAFSVAACSACP